MDVQELREYRERTINDRRVRMASPGSWDWTMALLDAALRCGELSIQKVDEEGRLGLVYAGYRYRRGSGA